MAARDWLGVLAGAGTRTARMCHVAELPARPGRTGPWPSWADADVVAGYRVLGVHRPWRHQVEAADLAWSGRHTVVATSTGSGKSLAFWLPALTTVRADRTGPATAGATLGPPGTVLYLCPTKALAADQLAALDRLLAAAGIGDVRTATCDGDTPADERPWIRDHAHVVLTNPDFLHFALLPGHARWARLLRGLRYVVVDESHAFRGVFGAHVAAVLRRLRRVARHYGADPVFLAASATTADPATSLARLIGVAPDEVSPVTADFSPRGRKTVVLWQPPELPGDDPLGPEDGADVPPAHRSAPAEAADLLADLTAAGARSLAFTRSRRAAESVAAAAQAHLGEIDPALAATVAAYRGGYLPEERRDLEAAIRDGRLRALATTNALELGVDISGLDAVLIAGWPGTRVSLWQQAGRAGRAGAEGLVVLIARDDPLDAYLVHHPEAVLGAPVEATVFDPANPYVLAPHLAAAAAELPVRREELGLFGAGAEALLEDLTTRGVLRRRSSGWYWTHAEPASRLTDLRGTGGDPVRVVEEATGRLLGTVDAGSADAMVHEGAVYVHQGAMFVVHRLDLEDGVALVERRAVDYATWARWLTAVEVRRTASTTQWGPVTWNFGAVDVTTQVIGYQRKRLPDLTVVGSQPLDLPARTLTTAATWWTAPAELLEAAGITAAQAPGALHAAEHASIGLLPLHATCDRWDLGGLSTAMHPDTGAATVFVHDALPGGAGFAERGYHDARSWLAATRDAVATCPCSGGCPSCVQSPKCGNMNNPLDKDAAVRLLDAVLSHAPDAPRAPSGPVSPQR